ncbi:M15 family metallopeptidase [Neobacillus sp. LXY-1]|uniref:M15 family metallopeptidase n=1 Tax=Neobacillus sp. LXY-1 TaxID=3379133 RepID=UPI003EE359CF
MGKNYSVLVALALILLIIVGCSEQLHFSNRDEKISNRAQVKVSKQTSINPQTKDSKTNDRTVKVVENPGSIPVLVNKLNMLPEQYSPSDLVYPDIPFIFEKKSSKREMRQEAAQAIEKLFASAKKDGVPLLGVSAYRSHTAQKTLFNYYVNRDGIKAAQTYSALPGTSEHETGLAIDVTGSDGKCAAENCFGSTKEAKWLARHAAEYGFIIRYPKGKETITGYQYEPWHLRYVGKTIAQKITARGITLEEYYNAIPVNK